MSRRSAGARGYRPVAIDLFSGAGGMSLGFEQAGFDVVAALEADPAHAAAHRFNFPWCEVVQKNAAIVTGPEMQIAAAKGLSALGREKLEAAEIDVVFGGPPCQGFSVGGRMDPHDSRNQLIRHFARLIAEIQPRAFVLENVPAMASCCLPGDHRAVPLWLASKMEESGFETSPPHVLNASWFGVLRTDAASSSLVSGGQCPYRGCPPPKPWLVGRLRNRGLGRGSRGTAKRQRCL